MVLEYGTFRLSLAGDAEPRAWAWWNANHPLWLKPVHVHKASRHGSINGDTAAAITALLPKAVVIGVGKGNTYRDPDPVRAQVVRGSGCEDLSHGPEWHRDHRCGCGRHVHRARGARREGATTSAHAHSGANAFSNSRANANTDSHTAASSSSDADTRSASDASSRTEPATTVNTSECVDRCVAPAKQRQSSSLPGAAALGGSLR